MNSVGREIWFDCSTLRNFLTRIAVFTRSFPVVFYTLSMLVLLIYYVVTRAAKAKLAMYTKGGKLDIDTAKRSNEMKEKREITMSVSKLKPSHGAEHPTHIYKRRARNPFQAPVI